MEETKQNKQECCKEETCCRPTKCCCGPKILAVAVLLLLGGIIGYLMGTRGGYYYHGHYGMPCPLETPAAPVK